MAEGRERIAELYYRSNTVKFGAFTLSIHRDRPDLPLSPWYLHYPKDDEPGSELLPELYRLIGAEFHDICEDRNIRPTRITGLPKGAVPLADALASHYENYPANLLRFGKVQYGDGRTEFTGPEGVFYKGDDLLPTEDHISGARNNKIFLAHARQQGFAVTKLLVVVDRQQGGPENMAAEGVEVIPIFTGDDLLEYGLAESHISQTQFDEVQAYRAANQFGLQGL